MLGVNFSINEVDVQKLVSFIKNQGLKPQKTDILSLIETALEAGVFSEYKDNLEVVMGENGNIQVVYVPLSIEEAFTSIVNIYPIMSMLAYLSTEISNISDTVIEDSMKNVIDMISVNEYDEYGEYDEYDEYDDCDLSDCLDELDELAGNKLPITVTVETRETRIIIRG